MEVVNTLDTRFAQGGLEGFEHAGRIHVGLPGEDPGLLRGILRGRGGDNESEEDHGGEGTEDSLGHEQHLWLGRVGVLEDEPDDGVEGIG